VDRLLVGGWPRTRVALKAVRDMRKLAIHLKIEQGR